MGDITSADGLNFDDGEHVKLADMNGDRLLDLVRIYVSNQPAPMVTMTWWPNRGRGHWGNHIDVASTLSIGVVDLADVFIRDINGEGLADVAAVAVDHVGFWLNQGNGVFSSRFEMA